MGMGMAMAMAINDLTLISSAVIYCCSSATQPPPPSPPPSKTPLPFIILPPFFLPPNGPPPFTTIFSMSTAIPFPPPSPLPSIPSATHYYITNLGLGYAIAIAFGFLVLFSSLLLASYICFRHRYSHRTLIRNPNVPGGGGSDNGVILPSIIFVDDDNNNEDQNVVVGLDQSVINSYPKFPFSKGIPKGIDSVCAICLCEYREAEMMRMLPDCKHCFHLTCVDAWLKLNATCPVCRSSPLPTPLSTPLAEVVPLSQYSDGRRRR